MQFMIYSNKDTFDHKCDRPTIYQTCATTPTLKQEQQNNKKNIIHCQSKWSCTSRNQIVPYHWQNINSITTGVASDNCDIFGKPIYKVIKHLTTLTRSPFWLTSRAGHFWKFCSRVLEINFGRDSRVSKIAFTEKILHTLHDFQLPAYQCEPDRHSTQSQTTLFRRTIQNAVIPSI